MACEHITCVCRGCVLWWWIVTLYFAYQQMMKLTCTYLFHVYIYTYMHIGLRLCCERSTCNCCNWHLYSHFIYTYMYAHMCTGQKLLWKEPKQMQQLMAGQTWASYSWMSRQLISKCIVDRTIPKHSKFSSGLHVHADSNSIESGAWRSRLHSSVFHEHESFSMGTFVSFASKVLMRSRWFTDYIIRVCLWHV